MQIQMLHEDIKSIPDFLQTMYLKDHAIYFQESLYKQYSQLYRYIAITQISTTIQNIIKITNAIRVITAPEIAEDTIPPII